MYTFYITQKYHTKNGLKMIKDNKITYSNNVTMTHLPLVLHPVPSVLFMVTTKVFPIICTAGHAGQVINVSSGCRQECRYAMQAAIRLTLE